MDGHIELSCPNCTIGDGVSKITPKPLSKSKNKSRRSRAAVFSSNGVTVPRLNLGNLTGEIELNKGVGTVKRFAAQSDHGELTIEGDIRFKDPFKNSTFPGCMRFKLSDSLKNSKNEAEKNFANLPDLMRVTPDPDGFSNVAMTGTLSNLRWRPRRKCPTSSKDKSRKSTPTVTTRPTPDKPKKNAKPDRTLGKGSKERPPELSGPNASGPGLH